MSDILISNFTEKPQPLQGDACSHIICFPENTATVLYTQQGLQVRVLNTGVKICIYLVQESMSDIVKTKQCALLFSYKSNEISGITIRAFYKTENGISRIIERNQTDLKVGLPNQIRCVITKKVNQYIDEIHIIPKQEGTFFITSMQISVKKADIHITEEKEVKLLSPIKQERKWLTFTTFVLLFFSGFVGGRESINIGTLSLFSYTSQKCEGTVINKDVDFVVVTNEMFYKEKLGDVYAVTNVSYAQAENFSCWWSRFQHVDCTIPTAEDLEFVKSLYDNDVKDLPAAVFYVNRRNNSIHILSKKVGIFFDKVDSNYSDSRVGILLLRKK